MVNLLTAVLVFSHGHADDTVLLLNSLGLGQGLGEAE